ncbi:hypothetical protein COV58_03500 [Candidatus Roizmanbacteria bacterium CG11_big_fil_rev_8_21_14_0_20_36_8]|uniref:ChsH2 C-terminal OB-fold domain-containing protein n=2 Tax=Candidatus Roizmaniibacteriota TaxID=1752723 RepID=A0A2M6ITQ0_9BACT|nr:MAG: hypothetical protein COV58_03500 [Candidatus Roizmanbacteria bacterium CG11_big_fil_rev_8_21_14_0_20_36_8]PIZ65003.1 MAG: hypothetical protein COY14_03315 [Candidatus Roizmanbacteria bacterium CG_4_10_14_0_2_um_filter_36_9]
MSTSPIRLWRNQKKDRDNLNLVGKIVSWTEIFVAPKRFKDNSPYTVLLVKLQNGNFIYGQLVDFEKSDREIGKTVKTVLRRQGISQLEEIVEYGVKFTPLP